VQAALARSDETLEFTTGDLALFPQDGSHFMGSDLRLTPVSTDTLHDPDDSSDDDFVHMRHGGGGAVTRFVCGYLACSRSVSRLLLEGLPGVVRIPIGDTPAASLIRELLRVGVRESSAERPGSSSMLAKVSELMFVEAMRRYVESLPPGGSGWLAGVRDAQIGRALGLLHAHPDKAWTVDQLAREVALSRSALAERFTALVGESPDPVPDAVAACARGAIVAVRGARPSRESQNAAATNRRRRFNRAFKREFGMPPATWRRAHHVAAHGASSSSSPRTGSYVSPLAYRAPSACSGTSRSSCRCRGD
jgi:AraC-like DNA-binding protein